VVVGEVAVEAPEEAEPLQLGVKAGRGQHERPAIQRWVGALSALVIGPLAPLLRCGDGH